MKLMSDTKAKKGTLKYPIIILSAFVYYFIGLYLGAAFVYFTNKLFNASFNHFTILSFAFIFDFILLILSSAFINKTNHNIQFLWGTIYFILTVFFIKKFGFPG